jgi:hypothetical protein
MNIGLFGDSYIDVIWDKHPTHTNIWPVQKTWSYQLLEELGSPILCSGLGGTNQFYAINQWHKQSAIHKFDYAIVTFTWEYRKYCQYEWQQVIFSAQAELRELDDREKCMLKQYPVDIVDELKETARLQNTYLRYAGEPEDKFLFELMVKYCMELPEQYPDTKFIFLPNTEFSKPLTQKYFKKGVLFDFAFETLSNRETGSPGVMPINCNRYGHLNHNNHTRFKELVKNIIIYYDNYKDKIYPVNYNDFDIEKS